MKIQLERNLKPHPHRLRCVVCQKLFVSPLGRITIRHRDGAMAGDLCRECLQEGTEFIQQQIKYRAIVLFKKPLTEDCSPSPHKRALELWEIATAPLKIPPFYYWWWQRSAIFTTATIDSIAGRPNSLAPDCCRSQSRFLSPPTKGSSARGRDS